MAQEMQAGAQPKRRREMYLMRILIVTSLVLFHIEQIIGGADHLVKNMQ